MSEQISEFATTCPHEALQLLRCCTGACRVEYLVQTAPPSEQLSELLESTSSLLRLTFERLLGSSLPPSAWAHATLPSRMGGLGLQDPCAIRESGRLAALVKAEELALELGADADFYAQALQEASTRFLRRVGASHQLLPKLSASTPNLQKQLTDILHAQRFERLFAAADNFGQVRLSSLAIPHAVAWTLGPAPWVELSPAVFRAGLRWILGLPLRPSSYRCPSCHCAADAGGQHAVVCLRSGAIGRGHTLLRDTLYDICAFAGVEVDKEQYLPLHPELRPADLLVRNWQPGGDLALDTTVVSPTLRSDPVRISEQGCASRLDAASEAKDRRSL